MAATGITGIRLQATPEVMRIFSRRAIGWLTFWFSLAAGLMLITLNLETAGERAKMPRYWAAVALTSLGINLFALINWPYIVLASFLLFNLAPLPFVLGRAAEYEQRLSAAGREPIRHNAWLAILLAIALLVATRVLMFGFTAFLRAAGA